MAEFTFLQNQFAADFGHSSGGQFNQVVKSGTNQFHGSAYEYFINRDLQAADNLNAVEGIPLHPRFDDNRFGGTFGGPIKKNKLFFFVNYEYNPIGTIGSTGTVCAPTAAGYTTINGIPGINQTNLSSVAEVSGHGCGGITRRRPAATAPIPWLGPEMRALNGPSPTGVSIPIGLVPVTSPAYTNNEFAVGSVDYNISDTDSLRGRFILNRTGSIDTSWLPLGFLRHRAHQRLILRRSRSITPSPPHWSTSSGWATTGFPAPLRSPTSSSSRDWTRSRTSISSNSAA